VGYSLKKNLRDTHHIMNHEIKQTVGVTGEQLLIYLIVFFTVFKIWGYIYGNLF